MNPGTVRVNAEKYFKGCKKHILNMPGVGMDFAEPLYRAGLLSHEKQDIKGCQVAPFDVIVANVPKPPKFEHEIKEIIDEGIVSDDGCMVIEAYGKKDGKDILVEKSRISPGTLNL